MGFSQYRALRALCQDRATRTSAEPVEFRIPVLREPIAVRPGTTDASSVIHTALRNGYGKYLPDGDVRLIVDAGANIGDTASWYLSRYPKARVVALEPDLANFQMLERNCRPYGSKVRILQKGIWPHAAYLKVTGDGLMESGFSVVETECEEDADCVGTSPMDILAESGEPYIDIFKCDIEGAELELFSSNCDSWLSRTRSIFIEIHNERARLAVTSATRRHSFSCRVYRDLHIFHKKLAA